MTDNGMDYGQQELPAPNPKHVLDGPTKVREFCLGGKAVFSLYSHKTTRHYTYRIKRSGNTYWVSRLTNPEHNEGLKWLFLGGLFDEAIRFGATKQTETADRQSIQFEIFNWFWDELQHRDKIHRKLSVFHEGKCARCGLPLTDPFSITQGFGPSCRQKRVARSNIDDRIES